MIKALSEDERREIFSGNALRVFPRLRQRLNLIEKPAHTAE